MNGFLIGLNAFQGVKMLTNSLANTDEYPGIPFTYTAPTSSNAYGFEGVGAVQGTGQIGVAS